jgi:hypothetical protein
MLLRNFDSALSVLRQLEWGFGSFLQCDHISLFPSPPRKPSVKSAASPGDLIAGLSNAV